MTDTPPTRAPRPRTAPATSEPGPEVGPTGPNAPTGPTETREPNAYEANRELFEELDRESKAAHEALEADDWDAWATHAGRGAELHKQIAERLGWDTSAPRYDTEETPPMPETAPRALTCQNLACLLPYDQDDSDAVCADSYCSTECEDIAEGMTS